MIPYFIIGGVLTFTIYWILRNIRKNSKSIIFLTLIASLLLSSLKYLSTPEILFNLHFRENHVQRDFAQKTWNDDMNNRHEMRTDLLENNTILGKTEDEIIEILGQPNSKISNDQDSLGTWRFNMGEKGHGLGWKFYTLVLEFEENRVIKFQIEEYID